VIVGGIIPPDDAAILTDRGVARVYTPKDYQINDMVADIVTVVRAANGLPSLV
jgi:(2R)-ethylmalonyl-CoA mutase